MSFLGYKPPGVGLREPTQTVALVATHPDHRVVPVRLGALGQVRTIIVLQALERVQQEDRGMLNGTGCGRTRLRAALLGFRAVPIHKQFDTPLMQERAETPAEEAAATADGVFSVTAALAAVTVEPERTRPAMARAAAADRGTARAEMGRRGFSDSTC